MNLFRQLNISVLLFRVGLLTAVIAITILAFAPISSNVNIAGSDKASHFFAFFALSTLVDGSWQETRFDITKGICVSLYALFIEIVQSQLPYRDFSWLDLVADMLGMAMYLLACLSAEKIVLHWKK